MNPVSILLFIFSGALLLYAALLALTKDVSLIPRGGAAKVKNARTYAKRFAGVIALVAVAPLHGGLAALFDATLGMAVLIGEAALAIWIGAQLMKDE
jgi:hypothetical protein